MQHFYLYNVMNNSYLGKSANGTSDLKLARVFSREDTLKIMRIHFHNGKLGVIPVAIDLIEEVTK